MHKFNLIFHQQPKESDHQKRGMKSDIAALLAPERSGCAASAPKKTVHDIGVMDREQERAIWDSEAGKSMIVTARRMAAAEQRNAGGEKPRKVFSSRREGVGKVMIDDALEGPDAFSEDERRAAGKVFTSSEGSIRKLASHYAGKRSKSGWVQSEIDASDFHQEGHLGLIKALTRYKSEIGNRFYTYAHHWVLNYMRDAFRRAIRASNGRINLYRMQADDDEEQEDPFSRIPDWREKNAEERYIEEESKDRTKKALIVLFGALSEFECVVIKKRFGFESDPLSLQNVGDQYNLSRERIRQIEERALGKMLAKAIEIGMNEAA